MATKTDSVSMGKLPLITEGRSLVSTPVGTRAPTVRDQAEEWNYNLRIRLQNQLAVSGEIPDEDAYQLLQEILSLFITVLQKDDRHSWMFFREILVVVEPLRTLIAGKQEVSHYVERLHHHLDVHKERLFDLHILDTLNKVFPQEIRKIKENGSRPAHPYNVPTPPRSVASGPVRKIPKKMTLPDGNNPFVLERPGDSMKFAPKGLTFGDLRASMPDVAFEVATREAIWGANLSAKALGFNVDLPEFPEEESESPLPSERSSEVHSASSHSLSEELAELNAGEEILPSAPMTGREAVEYFGKCFHTGKIKHMFFNVAPSRHYKPYDLVSVPKNKVNGEHYVFSTFGVLHVMPKLPAESKTLADWQREAVLYSAISQIPFYKHFLVRKMLRRWRANVHFREYGKLRRSVDRALLQAVPSFGAALLQMSQLCQELILLSMLPTQTDKMYVLGEFENAVNYTQLQAEKVLERFFRYGKIITDTTSQETFKKLKHCEEQVKHKTVFSKDSLYLQRVKRQQREENLQQARAESARLGNFVKLMDQLVLAHLVQLARVTMITYVHDNMELGLEANRTALLTTNLCFGRDDMLTITPSKEKLLQTMSRIFEEIPVLLCAAAVALDGSLQAYPIPVDDSVQDSEMKTPSPTPTKASSKYTSSIASLLKDPKKMRPEALRKSLAEVHSDLMSSKASIAETTRTSQGHSGAPSGGESVAGDGILHTPQLPMHEMNDATVDTVSYSDDAVDPPSKQEDDLGQATPDLIIMTAGNDDLVIQGLGFVGQYRPLTKGNLREKLANDLAYQRALSTHGQLMGAALEEVAEYCTKNAWLNEIYAFCKGWHDDSVKDWKMAAAFTIEQKLSEVRQWTERVRNSDSSYVTDNGVLHINCVGIHDLLIPKLKTAYHQLCVFTADEALALGNAFCCEMKLILENMNNKETSIGGFAIYAKNMNGYKRNTVVYQQQMEYIKSLYEVIRMGWRHLLPAEEKLEESVSGCWEAYLFNLQDAMEFVNTQTPLITQNLEDTFTKDTGSFHRAGHSTSTSAVDASRDVSEFMKLEDEARQLSERATSGKFLDPSENPTTVLIEMRQLREAFYDVQKSMEQASKWKEAITGEAYDLSFLQQWAVQMDVRQELWKYVEVSTHAVREWKGQLFRKRDPDSSQPVADELSIPFSELNARKALDKLVEWQAAAGQMKDHLPQGDGVLASWFRMLHDFKKELPILHKLAIDALKSRHWKAIFLAMGEHYDPEHTFTVEQLLSYNLSEHASAIQGVYVAALAEFAIEQRVVKVQKLWEEREFKLAKHIPDSIYKQGEEPPVASEGKRRGSSRRSRLASRSQQGARSDQRWDVNLRDQDLYVLIEADELLATLEDSLVDMRTMLTSPHVADHRPHVQRWTDTLAQVNEIVQLWLECQKKWLFLLKIFEDPEMYRRMFAHAQKFDHVHHKLYEIMQSIVVDPRITSIVTKPRGDRCYRLLQGDRLRNLLLELITIEEEVLSHLSTVLEDVRTAFPRLYFLSDMEVVAMLAVSRNPRGLLPTARKCFPTISSLTFSLPSAAAATSINQALDIELNAHQLEVSKLHGMLGEEVPLCETLRAYTSATRWLSTLETHMKTTMTAVTEACVQARLDEGSRQPIMLLEELSKAEQALNPHDQKSHEAERLAADIKYTFSHWLLRFPAQSVLAAEAVLWERHMFKALEKQDRDEVQAQRASLCVRMDQYVALLREQSVHCLPADMQKRLQLLLGSLVSQALHHRDIIDGLLQHQNLSDGAYDWLRVLKYHMDIRSVLRAKTENPAAVDAPAHQTPSTGDKVLHRSMTTISTGYQFGGLVVSQMGATFTFDYEYLGPSSRLHMCPLTERAYVTLTQALQAYQCGALTGPAGTGKTETIKDLAKALGRPLVTVNCTAGLEVQRLTQYLSGAVQSGVWTLFDDAHHIKRGVLSVFAQHLDYLGNALRVLDASGENQYGVRGQPRFDKKTATKSGEKKIRRNSLTTLHSLPMPEEAKGPLTLERQATVPHGFNEEGLVTYFADPWVKERERRHSIEKEVRIKESELYKTIRPPPLFYEHVTLHKKPKPDYKDLARSNFPYKPLYTGNILFNGRLVRANVNYGCFITLQNPGACHIPDNLRLCLRPCALVQPSKLPIIEAALFCHSFDQHASLAARLNVFFDLVHTQLPRQPQYKFGLCSINNVLETAVLRLHHLRSQEHTEAKRKEERQQKMKPINTGNTSSQAAESGGTTLLDMTDSTNTEERALIQALTMVMEPKMACNDDLQRLRSLLRDVFPSSARPHTSAENYHPELVQAVEEQLQEDNLQTDDDLILKILQLHSALQQSSSVMLVGAAGCGKTTIYQTLARTLNTICSKDAEPYADDTLTSDRSFSFVLAQKIKVLRDSEPRPDLQRTTKNWRRLKRVQSVVANWEHLVKEEQIKFICSKVNTKVIFPNALTASELYGEDCDGVWHTGLLADTFRGSHAQVEYQRPDDKKQRNGGGVSGAGAESIMAAIHKWVVLDGEVGRGWVEGLHSLLDSTHILTFPNGEAISLHNDTRVLFEVGDLTSASPSLLTRSSLLHCGSTPISWRRLVDSWLTNAKEPWVISTAAVQVLTGLVSSVITPTVTFITTETVSSNLYNTAHTKRQCEKAVAGIPEATSFVRLMTVLCNRFLLREEWEKQTSQLAGGRSTQTSSSSPSPPRIEDHIPHYLNTIKYIFTTAYIWAYGGPLHDSMAEKFDVFARETLRRGTQPITLPDSGTVFDYYFDRTHGEMVQWADSSKASDKATKGGATYTMVPQVERYNAVISMLLANDMPILIIGHPGVGKTAFVENVIHKKFQLTRAALAHGTSSEMLQSLLHRHLDDHQQRSSDSLYGGATKGLSRGRGRHLFFLDDLNKTSIRPDNGCQPTSELLRQILQQGAVYDRKRHVSVNMANSNFVACATTPGALGACEGASSHVLSARLLRHFTTITMAMPSDATMHTVFGRSVLSWLEEFPTYSVEHHHEFADALVQGVLDLYGFVHDKLLMTPGCAQYLYTLHDVARVFDGLLLMSPRSKTRLRAQRANKKRQDITAKRKSLGPPSTPGEGAWGEGDEVGGLPPMMRAITRLWCHEVTRVFSDRITGEDDQRWFDASLEEVVFKNFCTGSDDWLEEPMTTIQESCDSQAGTPYPETMTMETGTSSHITPEPHQSATPQDVAMEAEDSTTIASQEVTSSDELSHKVTASDADDKEEDSSLPSVHGMGPTSGPITYQSPSLQRHVGVQRSQTGHTTMASTSDSDTESESTDSETMTTLTATTTPQQSARQETHAQKAHQHKVSSATTPSSPTSSSQGSSSLATSCTPLTLPESPYPTPSPHPNGGRHRKTVTMNAEEQKSRASSQQSEATPAPPYRRSLSKAGAKRGVTFKAGLIADRQPEIYGGPLMTMDQIKDPGEDLTDFIFCRHIIPTHAEAFGMQVEKGYLEYTEDQVAEALYTCLQIYNKTTSQKIDLVFFREAVQHAARLSRVLATPGGHALLLGTTYCTGRTTLVSLAAHIANCKLFEMSCHPVAACTRDVVREHLRQCGRAAGLHGTQAVLLLRGNLGSDVLQDVCAFMKEGTCPGLYNQEEIQTIVAQMTPGQVKTTRLDKIEAGLHKFLGRVQQNLHIIVCLHLNGSVSGNAGTSGDLHSLLQQLPMLVTGMCHVDVYRPWTHDAFVSIAEFWLRDPTAIVSVPWYEPSKSEQITMVAIAMAYIHNSAKVAVEKLFSHQQLQYHFFSPLTFTEFVHIFKVIAAHITQEERTKIEKFQSGLGKMNHAFESIASFRRDVSNLVPQHQKALGQVKEHVEFVEVQREEYKQALETCRVEEEKIERMLSPLEAMRSDAQAEFDKVNPAYQAALRALNALSPRDIDEVRSYRVPPVGVIKVMRAICLLFKEPQTWEQSKKMLMKDNFFQELEFYDKDHITDATFQQLADICHDPDFSVEISKVSSNAVGDLCRWVFAVYDYASVCRTMQPRIQELLDAENEFNRAQAELGAKRVEANRIKSALEQRIKAHKEAVFMAKDIEKNIQTMERNITKATHLMENMKPQHSQWKAELKVAKTKMKAVPGDALIAAACVCYHGPLDNRTRAELMSDWLNRCELANFDPMYRLGRQVKPMSLSAKLETFMKPAPHSYTDSVHSIQHLDPYQAEVISHRGDDVSSIHETERASSASSMPQMSLYKHYPSIYDTGISYRTEIRVLDNTLDLESIDASSMSARNLLATRDSFTLQEVLSTFEELSAWKGAGLPSDVFSIHNGLIMRLCCRSHRHCWPLLVDPDDRAEAWVRALQDTAPDDHTASGADLVQPVVELASNNLQGTDAQSHNIKQEQANGSTESVSMVTHDMGGLVEETIIHPDNNLWVVAIDDADLEYKLVNAVVHGVTVLVTHVERGTLPEICCKVLHKQTVPMTTGGASGVQIGKGIVLPWHPQFCLYLSTSAPLFLKGDGIHELPTQKMSVVSMATSQEGVIDLLLGEVLRVERPEYEGQKSAVDRELLEHQHTLNRQHTAILSHTLDVGGSLLEDATMLQTLQGGAATLQHANSMMEEAQYMRSHLDEKRSHLVTVATHGAQLYDLVQRVSVLSPYYHLTLSNFLKLFAETIQSRHRGKGCTGMPKARAQELIDATTGAIYTHVSAMMFQQHGRLFATLVTLERLRLSQQLTNQELGLFVNGVDTSDIEDNLIFDDRPQWLSNKVWLDTAALETTLPAFRGLRQTLATLSREWLEYFRCPFVLMTPLPGCQLDSLTSFQKCLLWRICEPQKMAEVCEALVLHELGGIVPPPCNYSIPQVYSHCDKATPAVFLLPSCLCENNTTHNSSKGHTFANPTHEILQFAKERGMEGWVHAVTCGVDTQSSEIQKALEECIHAGYWLVIQNAHLGAPWSPTMLHLLQTIVSSNPNSQGGAGTDTDAVTTAADDTQTEYSETREMTPKLSLMGEDLVHRDFRLWVTTRTDHGNLIPGLLVQRGRKVTCEVTHNFTDLLRQTYHNADKLFSKRDRAMQAIRKMYGPLNHLVPIATLYSTLVYRQGYGAAAVSQHSFWSQLDLSAILDLLRTIVLLCQQHRGVAEACGDVLSGHCLDMQDLKVVQAFTRAILQPPDQLDQLQVDSPGVAGLLGRLLPDETGTLTEKLDALISVTPESIGLSSGAETEFTLNRSRNLLDDLVRVIGAPELMSTPMEQTQRRAELILMEIQNTLHNFPTPPRTSTDAFYPLDAFIHAEVTMTTSLVDRIRTDVEHLLNVARGTASLTRDSQTQLLALSHHQIPHPWLAHTFPTWLGVLPWVASLHRRMEMLRAHLDTVGGSGPASYDLGMFQRPDRFIHAVLQTFVRKEFKNLHTCRLHVTVLPAGDPPPTAPPVRGVYLRGLILHHAAWDPTQNSLAPSPTPTTPAPLPIVWLQPVDKQMLERQQRDSQHQLYDCPIHMATQHRSLGWQNIVGTIELPTLYAPSLWAEKRVFLTTGV